MENTPNLLKALGSLNLPSVKFDETGSVKITDLHSIQQQADITRVEDLSIADNELLSALRDPSSMATDIVKYLKDLRGNGFNACSPRNKHKIPVEIPTGTIDFENLPSSLASMVDDSVAVSAHFVINSFKSNEERNPFTIFEPGSPEFKEQIEKAEYKGVFIRNLVAQHQQEPNRSEEAQLQSIKDSESWRHALMHTATGEGDSERANYRSRMYSLQILQMYRWFCALEPPPTTKPILKTLCAESHIAIRRDLFIALRVPIVAIKEGTGADNTVEENKLAVMALPHLVSFLLLHLRGETFDQRKHIQPLPKDDLIFGTLYDDTRATIYAHFPYLSVAEQSWRFCQMKVVELEYAQPNDVRKRMSLENGCKRAELAIAAHIVREHGRRLCERFTSGEYTDLVEGPAATNGSSTNVAKIDKAL